MEDDPRILSRFDQRPQIQTPSGPTEYDSLVGLRHQLARRPAMRCPPEVWARTSSSLISYPEQRDDCVGRRCRPEQVAFLQE
jgi:hypothetical protein